MYQHVSVCAQTDEGDVSFSLELSFFTTYSISASSKVQIMRNKSFHCLGLFSTLLGFFSHRIPPRKEAIATLWTNDDTQCIIFTTYIYTRGNDCTRKGVCNCTSASSNFEIAKTHHALCRYDQREEL